MCDFYDILQKLGSTMYLKQVNERNREVAFLKPNITMRRVD